jgi:murein DD-endopeptidase MepM/ murein hydrolase activator NlpD
VADTFDALALGVAKKYDLPADAFLHIAKQQRQPVTPEPQAVAPQLDVQPKIPKATVPKIELPDIGLKSEIPEVPRVSLASRMLAGEFDPSDLPKLLETVKRQQGIPAGAPRRGGARPTPTTGPADLSNWKPGSPVPGGSVGGEHGTSGLAGFTGKDYFGKPGSAVVAPVGGRITRFSGHDPRLGAVQGAGGPLGWSLYLKGNDGRVYYLTHLGSRTVKVGQKVKPGQTIGTIADYDRYGRPSHVHMGYRGGR